MQMCFQEYTLGLKSSFSLSGLFFLYFLDQVGFHYVTVGLEAWTLIFSDGQLLTLL